MTGFTIHLLQEKMIKIEKENLKEKRKNETKNEEYMQCMHIYIYKHIYTVYNKYIVLNEFKQKYDVKAIEGV